MDEKAKKCLMRKLPYGTFVVGAVDGQRLNASTVSWLCQSSLQPPQVMMALRHGTLLHDLVLAGRVFTINFLGREQQDVAAHFARPVSQAGDKLGTVAYHTGVTGAPILDDSLGYLECRVTGTLKGGDHDVVVGEVVEAELYLDAPVLESEDTGWHYGE